MWSKRYVGSRGENVCLSIPLHSHSQLQVNKYLLKKVLDTDSKYQSHIAPIPRFPRTQNEPSCINFTGRVISMLIKITDAQYTTFSLERSGWFMADGSEVCGSKAVYLLRQAIGVYGLTGVDRLLVCVNFGAEYPACRLPLLHLNSYPSSFRISVIEFCMNCIGLSSSFGLMYRNKRYFLNS